MTLVKGPSLLSCSALLSCFCSALASPATPLVPVSKHYHRSLHMLSNPRPSITNLFGFLWYWGLNSGTTP
jgi:hypothetical protein